MSGSFSRKSLNESREIDIIDLTICSLVSIPKTSVESTKFLLTLYSIVHSDIGLAVFKTFPVERDIILYHAFPLGRVQRQLRRYYYSERCTRVLQYHFFHLLHEKREKGKEIVVKDLIKVHKTGQIEVQALRGLNMTVDGGEMISLIGPSGSGKTTLLNIIGGLDSPTAGEVRVGTVQVSSLSPSQLVEFRRRTVGHIFQNLNLIPTLTASENIELPMLAQGLPHKKMVDRVKMLLDVVGLADRASHKPDEMSGGEQQRAAIATALANDPPVVLADEPTGELDTENSRIVTEFLVKVNKELGKTIIVVTHNPDVARAAQRIMRIEDGVIKAFLEPAQISAEGAPVSYAEQLRARVAEVDRELTSLDEVFRTGKIGGDEYTDRRTRLRQTRLTLQDELHRLGVVI